MAGNQYDDALEQLGDTRPLAPSIFTPPPSTPAAPAPAGRSIFTSPTEALERERVRTALGPEAPSPDEAARVYRAQLRTGLPLPLIRRNLADIERETTRRDFDADAFRRTSPLLASWLASDEYHAALAADDIVPLSAMEAALDRGRALVAAPVAGLVRQTAGGFWGTVHAATDVLADEFGLRPMPAVSIPFAGVAGYQPMGLIALGDRIGRAFQTVQEFARTMALASGGTADLIAGDRSTRAGFIERNVLGGLESAGAMLPFVVLGPEAMLASAGVGTGGTSYTQATSQGVSPERARAFAAWQGIVEVGTEYIPAHKLIGDLAAGAAFRTLLAHQVKSELVGEEVATALQDAAEWAVLPENSTRTFGDYLRERPSAAAATAIAVLTTVGATSVVAHGTARVLEQLGDSTQRSKTAARLPGKVGEFLDAATADGTLARVYLPIESVTRFYQEAGDDPAAATFRLTGDPRAFERARETGADLVVPIGRYATEIGADAARSAFFANEARFTPAAPNAREVSTAAGDVHAAASAVERTPDPAAAVVEAATAEFQRSGFTADVSRTYADIVGAAFRSIGTRADLDPLALYDKYGLTVERSARPADETGPVAVPAAQQTHFAQLEQAARANGFTGDVEVLKRAYVAALAQAQTIARDMSSGEDAGPSRMDLLEAISRLGGIGIEAEGQSSDTKRTGKLISSGGMVGELENLLEGLNRQTGRIRRGPRAGQRLPKQFRRSGGLPGAPSIIVRKGGLSLDYVRESIDQDPRWAGKFEDLSTFMEAVEDAVLVELGTRTPPAAARVDVEGVMENLLRVTPDARWWEGDRTFAARSGRRVLGQITFGKLGGDRSVSMDIFTGASLGTVLHEVGHFHLELLADVGEELAARDLDTLTATQKQILADYGATLGWLGVERREQIGAAQHEQFAEAFEQYLLDGKAPSVELRHVFARVRAWLLAVYRSVRKLDVELTPEVRGVLDRLLATDTAMRAAEREAGDLTAPLLSKDMATRLGLSPEQEAKYRGQLDASLDEARTRVQNELIAEFRREREAWWREERAGIRADLAPDIAGRPVYRALALLQHGLDVHGRPLPEGTAFKLDRPDLVRQFGEDVVGRLPADVTTEGGFAPNVAAELLGFRSSTAMMKALTTAAPLEAAIDAAADAEMKQRHGDRLADPVQLADDAAAAVLDARADVFATEIDLLERLATQETGAAPAKSAPPATIRALAERRIRETTLADLKPGLFLAAARRAGRQAVQHAGRQQYRAALLAKQRQLLNTELHRAATDARDRIDAARDRWSALFRPEPKVAERYNVELHAAARALLGEFGLTPKRVGTETAATYLEQVARYDPALYADLSAAVEAASQPGRPYRSLTVDEFRALADAVDNLVALARRSRQVLLDGRKVDVEEAVHGLATRLDAITRPTETTRYGRAKTKWEATKIGLLGVRAALRRVESWVDAVDGGKPDGVFRRTLFTPVSEAASRYRVAKRTTLERYLAIVKGVEAGLTTDPIDAPEIGYQFAGKVELLHALLHTGNESNLAKLLLGESEGRPAWASRKADGSLDTTRWDRFVRRMWAAGVLGQAEYDYAQAVWDLNESLKPDAQRVHHDLYGYYFAEITAHPVETPFGSYRGGYMPAVYDPLERDDVARRADREALEQTPNSFLFPTAGRGFTKARVEPYARPMWLHLGAVPMHLDKVLRFIHLEPAVKDAARVVLHKGFAKELHEFDPAISGELLVPWLQRTAKQLVEQPATGTAGRLTSRFFRTVRTRTGLQIMTGNVLNALQQITGLSIAAVKVEPRALSRSLWQDVRAPQQTANDVAEKSAFMRTRTTASVIEVQQTIDDLLLNPTQYERVRSFGQRHGYFLQQGFQNVVDVVTWRAAYDVAVGGGWSEPAAIRQADAAVRQTQGSFNPEDVSKFEAGSAFVRAFSMFYSYFNMQANLLGTEFTIAMRDLGLRAGAGRAAYVYTFGFLIPAVLGELIMRAGTASLGDDDDDGMADELLAIFFGSQLRTGLAMLPVVGPIVNTAVGQFTEARFDDRISTSPAVSAIESAARVPHDVYRAIADRDVDKATVRDTLTLVGLLTGLPAAALGRPLGYALDVAQGKTEPANAADAVRGAVVGR